MTHQLTAPITAIGAASMYTAVKFDDSMRSVKAKTGATGEEFEALRDQARQLGRDTRYSASEAATGMDYLAMAGFKVNEVMATMPDMLNLASATNTDLANTADIASNILTGFGLKATDMGRAADVMALACASSNTDLTQLGEAMAYAAPVANDFGMSIEETAAAVGFLSNAGIQSSMAGTTLRGMLTKLSNPTAEATELLNKYGLSLQDVNPEINSFTEIIGKMEKAGISATDMMAIMGQRAGPGTGALLSQGYENLRTYTEELENSDGAAARMAETMEEGPGGALRKMKSALESVTITLGDTIATAMLPFIDTLTILSAKLSEFGEAHPELLTKLVMVGAVVATVGPALLALGAGLSVAGSAFSALSVIVGPFIGIFQGVASVIGLLMTGLGGLSFTAIIGGITTAIGSIGAVLGSISISGILGGFATAVTSLGASFATISISAIVGLAGPILAVVSAVGLLYGAFKVFTDKDVMDSIDFKKLIEPLKNIYSEIKVRIMPMINQFADFAVVQFKKILSWWDENGDTIIAAISPLIDIALDVVENVLPYVIDVLGASLDLILNSITFFAQVLSGDWASAWSTLGDIFVDVFDIVVGIIKGAIVGLGTLLYDSGVSLMHMFADGIKSAIGIVGDSTEDAVTEVDSYMTHSPAKKGPLSTLPNWSAIFEGIEDVDTSRMAENAVSGMSAAIRGIAPSALVRSGAVSANTNYDYSSGDVIVHLDGPLIVREEADIKKIAQELHKLTKQRTRGAGVF